MDDMRGSDVDFITIGQYLRPTAHHRRVHRYVEPSMFDEYKAVGEGYGITHVESGPLVRSSYHAKEALEAIDRARLDIDQAVKNGDNVAATNLLEKINRLAQEIDKLGSQKLMPGMPVETFIKTTERSPLSYLTKPLTAPKKPWGWKISQGLLSSMKKKVAVMLTVFGRGLILRK